MKTLTAAALALLMSTSTFAEQAPGTSGQSPSASPTPSSQPAGNEGQSPATQHNQATESTSGSPSGASADASHFQTNQGQDQWLVGNVWHKSVYNKAGQSIGDLNDILIDKDGKIGAIVVGVGGFLGLGEKNVAVNFDQVQQKGSISPDRIVLDMSEQDLRNAPTFQNSSSSSGFSGSR